MIDWHFLSLYHRFLAVKPEGWRVEIQRNRTHRDDGAGWRRDYFSVSLQCSINTCDAKGDWNWNRHDLERELPELEWAAMKRNQPAETGFWQRIFGVKK